MTTARLTNTQVYYLKRIATGVTLRELLRWDQRALRGLFVRKFFTFNSNLDATITSLGWEVYEGCTKARLRKDPRRPMFNGAERWRRRRRA